MDTALTKRAGNRALRANPPNADISLGRWGSNWGWTVFCLMAASTLGLLILSTMLARNRRAFHYLLTAVLAISTISWYSMASDLGSTPITVQFLRNNPLGGGYGGYPTRQIWYSRYIDWTLTTSLLLLSLLLITGLPLSIIFITIFFNLLMIVCGLLGALTRSRYKWGYFVRLLGAILADTLSLSQVSESLTHLFSTPIVHAVFDLGLCLRGTRLCPVPHLRFRLALGSTTRRRVRSHFPGGFGAARLHLAHVRHLLGSVRRRECDRSQRGGECSSLVLASPRVDRSDRRHPLLSVY